MLTRMIALPGHNLLTYVKDIKSNMGNKTYIKIAVLSLMEKLLIKYISIYGSLINKLYYW